MIWYAIASLTPAATLALACLFGGLWPLMAVLSITVLAFFMDRTARVLAPVTAQGRALSLSLAAAHFGLLALSVMTVTSVQTETVDKLLIFTAAGLFFGQISNSNAHELIHGRDRLTHLLGTAIYTSLLHGHHVSAHLRVHHIYAGTDLDPNSARLGLGFWRYVLRAPRAEFRAGFDAEQRHRARAAQRLPLWSHPFVIYILGGVATGLAAYLITGIGGVLAYLGLAIYAQLQLYLSDYVQHYGLRRKRLANGKLEPIGAHHSWNAPKWYSSAMMLNAPRHSDHHLRPHVAFPALNLDVEAMPMLPHSLPVMAVLALIPPLWRRQMDHRVGRWHNPA